MKENHDNYNFESLNTDNREQTSTLSNKNTLKKKRFPVTKLLVILIVVSLLIGFRWRYSFGGKLILINAFTLLIPYYFMCLRLPYKSVRIQTLAMVLSSVISFSIAIHGYINHSVGKLTVDKNIITTEAFQGAEVRLYANGEPRNLEYLNVRSTNEEVAFIYEGHDYIYTEKVGTSKLSIFDDYGNKVNINVTVNPLRKPTAFTSNFVPVIRVNESEPFYISALGYSGSHFEITSRDTSIAGTNYTYIDGIKVGTTTLDIKNDTFPSFSEEVSIIDSNDYIWSMCEPNCSTYSVGDEIDVASVIPEDAKNIKVTPDGSVFKFDGDRVIAANEGDGSINIRYNDIDHTLSYYVSKSKVKAATVANYTGNTVKLKDTINLGITTYPLDVEVEKIEYSVSDSSVATIDKEGNLTAMGNGYTFVTIRVNDKSIEIPVFVQQ